MAIIVRKSPAIWMPQMKKNFRSLFSAAAAAALLFSSTACHQQRVVLAPGEDDLVMLNGCVVSACNYLAVVKTQNALDKNFWAKILLVRFQNHPADHAYCVWETEGNIYGYDRNSGEFPLPVYTRDPRAIAIVLAQELARILKEPMAVSNAEFVNANEAELYNFSTSDTIAPASPMAAFVQIPPIARP